MFRGQSSAVDVRDGPNEGMMKSTEFRGQVWTRTLEKKENLINGRLCATAEQGPKPCVLARVCRWLCVVCAGSLSAGLVGVMS